MIIFGRFGKLHEWKNKIKWFFQRGIKGYCDRDLWDIDIWFTTIFPKMLDEFDKTRHGYPCALSIEDEIKFRNDDEIWEQMNLEWSNTLQEMAKLFIDAKPDFPRSKINEQAKDEAFKLLSEHFYNLWD